MTAVATRTEKCLYEFDGFRVDPVRRRLLRDGEPVPITPKAFSILLILIENRGDVVEKDDIIQKVWPDTFVTEANLTQNISSLRKALGERANDARYIVTVPGRGYSFVGDVVEHPRDATGEISLSLLSQALEVLPVQPEPSPPPTLTTTPRPAPSSPPLPPPEPPAPAAAPPEGPFASPEIQIRYRVADPLDTVQIPPTTEQKELAVLSSRADGRSGGGLGRWLERRTWLWIAGVLALVAVAALAVLLSRARPGTVTGRPSVAVLGIRDLSGQENQAWLASGLAEMLTSELSTGSAIRVISGQDVALARQSLELSDLEVLSQEKREQVRTVLGAEYVVTGSYLALGGQGLRLDLRVIKLPGGEMPAAFSEDGTTAELSDLVSRAGRRLRREMGWGELSAEEAEAARSLHMSSPRAVELYAQGLSRLRAYDARGARDLLQKAAEADPGAPMIRAALAQAWLDLGSGRQAAAVAEEARELGKPLPRQERLLLDARVHEARNEWSQASEIYRSLWTFYPDNLDYGLRLARGLTESGRGKEVGPILAELRRLPPPDGEDPRIDLAEAAALKRISDFPGALAAAERAAEKGKRFQESQIVAEALALKGDSLLSMSRPQDAGVAFDEARQRFERAGNRSSATFALTRKGIALHEQGKVTEAEAIYNESLKIAQEIGHDRLVAIQLGNLALFHQDKGDLKTAREMLERSLASFRGVGDRVLENRSRVFIGRVQISQGELAAARKTFEETLAASREAGVRIDEARSLDQLGVVLARQGSLGDARRNQEEALRVVRPLNDPNRTSAIEASLAWTLAHLGDVAGASRLLDSALQAKREVDDPLGIGVILDQQSEIALQRGDLAAARRLAEEQLRITREARAGLLAAAARYNLGRTEMEAGNLGAARQHFQDALAVTTAAGERIDNARLRLGLAQLELIDGRPAAAAEHARQAGTDCAARGMVSCQAEALALLAQSLAAQGQRAEARQQVDQALQLAGKTEDRWTQFQVGTAAEGLTGSSPGEVRRALGHLHGTAEEATKLGLLATSLEARLTLGSLQAAGADPAAGREELRRVRLEAERRGMRLLARRAAEAAGLPRPPLTAPQPNLG